MKISPDALATGRDLCAWFNAGTSRPVRESSLRVWAKRGKLAVRGQRNGANLYRYGDVAALLARRHADPRSTWKSEEPCNV